MEQRFQRQQLHDLVWSEPLTLLGPRFGMSDVALAKICKRHGIPIPGRGHWAKLRAGKPSPRFPLTPRGLGATETIHIGHSSWNERKDEEQALMVEDILPPPEFTEPFSDLVARVIKLVGRVPRSRDLKSPHRAYEQRVERKAELIEAERQRQEEAARKERERQRRLEQARIEKLLQEAMSLRLADDIRGYVAAVNARNAESADPVPDPQMADWSRWALEQADRIDPVRARAFLQPAPEPEEDQSAGRLRAGRAGRRRGRRRMS